MKIYNDPSAVFTAAQATVDREIVRFIKDDGMDVKLLDLVDKNSLAIESSTEHFTIRGQLNQLSLFAQGIIELLESVDGNPKPPVQQEVKEETVDVEGARIRTVTKDTIQHLGLDKRRGIARHHKDYESATPFKFNCDLCSFRSRRPNHLRAHMRHHEEGVPIIKCEQCEYKCIRSADLARHKNQHSNRLFVCDVKDCKYTTSEESKLRRHRKCKHGKENSEASEKLLLYECSKCDYKTLKLSFFQRHNRKHRVTATQTKVRRRGGSGKELSCDKCTYTSRRRENLTRHINSVHENDRKFLCNFCGVGFKRNDTLKQHLTLHANQPTPVLEEESKKAFSRTTCSVCHKVCRSRTELSEHMSGVHVGRRDFLCHVCGAGFRTKGVQQRHLKTVHKESTECRSCKKKFSDHTDLVTHLKEHEDNVPVIYTLDISGSEADVYAAAAAASGASDGLSTYLINESGQILLSTQIDTKTLETKTN